MYGDHLVAEERKAAKGIQQAKRQRQNEKAKMRNKAIKTRLKTLTDKVTQAKSGEQAVPIKNAIVFINKATSKNVLKKNTARRKISRLMKLGAK